MLISKLSQTCVHVKIKMHVCDITKLAYEVSFRFLSFEDGKKPVPVF